LEVKSIQRCTSMLLRQMQCCKATPAEQFARCALQVACAVGTFGWLGGSVCSGRVFVVCPSFSCAPSGAAAAPIARSLLHRQHGYTWDGWPFRSLSSVLRARLASSQRKHGKLALAGSASVSATPNPAADWAQDEIARWPVVLFAESTGSTSQAAVASLREAGVQFETMEVDRFGHVVHGDGRPWSSLIAERVMSSSGQTSLPVLYVGGQPLGGSNEINELATKNELRSCCSAAGAQTFELPKPMSETGWTQHHSGRWFAPKDLDGRRWYQDAPGSARYPGEYKEPARLEWALSAASPVSGVGNWDKITPAGRELLREDTSLDQPDPHGVFPKFRELGKWDVIHKPDLAHPDETRTQKKWLAKRVNQRDANREGLSIAQLKWVYLLKRTEIIRELKLRQCYAKVLTTNDNGSLREALMDELRKEIEYSPTNQGLTPGIVQQLSGPQFKEERYADTDVPLLLSVVSHNNPASIHQRDHVEAAARNMLRAIRVVMVDGQQYPEVTREFRVMRFPTLIWMQGRTGDELARRVGVASTRYIREQTIALVRPKELADPDARALVVADSVLAMEPESRWKVGDGVLREGDNPDAGTKVKWRSTRALRNSFRGGTGKR